MTKDRGSPSQSDRGIQLATTSKELLPVAVWFRSHRDDGMRLLAQHIPTRGPNALPLCTALFPDVSPVRLTVSGTAS
jgi:hypothetical protein